MKSRSLVTGILNKDRATYGINDYEIRDEEHSDVQAEMNEILEAHTFTTDSGGEPSTSTATAGNASPMSEGETPAEGDEGGEKQGSSSGRDHHDDSSE
jgi:hypothetical protein